MYKAIELKSAPEVLRVIRAADPTYRKHRAYLHIQESVSLSANVS